MKNKIDHPITLDQFIAANPSTHLSPGAGEIVRIGKKTAMLISTFCRIANVEHWITHVSGDSINVCRVVHIKF